MSPLHFHQSQKHMYKKKKKKKSAGDGRMESVKQKSSKRIWMLEQELFKKQQHVISWPCFTSYGLTAYICGEDCVAQSKRKPDVKISADTWLA